MAMGCVVVGGVVVVVATVTATMVYLGHAIDFHVSHHLPCRCSQQKVKQSTVEIVSKSFSEIRRIYAIEFDVYE